MPETWKAARDADEVSVEWGDVRLQLVPANGRFCFCAGCCPEPEAVWAWLESIHARQDHPRARVRPRQCTHFELAGKQASERRDRRRAVGTCERCRSHRGRGSVRYTVKVSGVEMVVHRRPDGKFVVPAEIAKWRGQGTAWKPAHEPVVVAMKPLAGTFARNAVEHGVAGLNVDGARIAASGPSPSVERRESSRRSGKAPTYNGDYNARKRMEAEGRICNQIDPERYMEDRPGEHAGRYPSNLLLTHSPPVRWYSLLDTTGEEVRATIHSYYGVEQALRALRRAVQGYAVGDQEAAVLLPGVRWRAPQEEPAAEQGVEGLRGLRDGVPGLAVPGGAPAELFPPLQREGVTHRPPRGGSPHRRESPEDERGCRPEADQGAVLSVEGGTIREQGLQVRDDRPVAGADPDVRARDDGGGGAVRSGAPGGHGGETGAPPGTARTGPPHQRGEGRQPAGESGDAQRTRALHETPEAGESLQRGAGGDREAARRGGSLEVREDLIPAGWREHFVLSATEGGCRRAGTRTVASNSHHPAARGRGGLGTSGHAGQDDLEERRGPEEVAAWECSPDCPVAAMDLQAGNLSSGLMRAGTVRAAQDHPGSVVYGTYGGNATNADTPADSGSASRFFFQAEFEPGELPAFGLRYCTKASTAERGGTRHPTIKPLELVAYLAKLLLPPAREGAPRRLLVPFSGAGSEMIGALRVGWEEVVGIEQEAEWIADSERRIRDDAPLWNQVEVVERESAVPSPADTDAEVTG